jgi:hypothetical protein
VTKQYRREFSVRVATPRATIYRFFKQFEETGSVCDKCAKGHKLSASVRTEEVVGEAKGDNNKISREK